MSRTHADKFYIFKEFEQEPSNTFTKLLDANIHCVNSVNENCRFLVLKRYKKIMYTYEYYKTPIYVTKENNMYGPKITEYSHTNIYVKRIGGRRNPEKITFYTRATNLIELQPKPEADEKTLKMYPRIRNE